MIPSAVEKIHIKAFSRCSSSTRVVFDNYFEEFLSAQLMRHLWNHGRHEKSLSTYSRLATYSIPAYFDLFRPRKWLTAIHEMLMRIPSISAEGMKSHFKSIYLRLALYGVLEMNEVPMLLELAILNYLI
jgi:hypothetical protein